MNHDIVLCGVGGQGVLSLASIIATAASEQGLQVKQSEVHGMSQRGGAVMATLRIADHPIASPLVSQGRANLLLSMEPLESLRYLPYLSPHGTLISAEAPFRNIPNYPDLAELYSRIRALPVERPELKDLKIALLDAEKLARESGSARASNVVLVGAASKVLPIEARALESAIEHLFARKGASVTELNLKAFRAGRELGASMMAH